MEAKDIAKMERSKIRAAASARERSEKRTWGRMSKFCRNRDYSGASRCHWSFQSNLRGTAACDFKCCPIIHGE